MGSRESGNEQANIKCPRVLGAMMLTKAGCGRQEVGVREGTAVSPVLGKVKTDQRNEISEGVSHVAIGEK